MDQVAANAPTGRVEILNLAVQSNLMKSGAIVGRATTLERNAATMVPGCGLDTR